MTGAVAVLLVAGGLGACSSEAAGGRHGATGATRPTTTERTTITSPSSHGSGSTSPDSSASTTATPDPSVPAHPSSLPVSSAPVDPSAFRFASEPLDQSTRERMWGVSIRAGCPVPFEDLRLVHFTHWDFDAQVQTGELVVSSSAVEDLRRVFSALYRDRFPIRRMQLVDDFGPADDPTDGADDFASIEADNTSAFNCRTRTGSKEFSQHSYGTAIDVNPIENPYVSASGRTSHPASVTYLDRANVRPGMAVPDGPLVRAFTEVGWTWGGTWSDVLDLQHFSENGR